MPTEDVMIVPYGAVDDWLRTQSPLVRPGPKPQCADNELRTLSLARERLGVDAERRVHRRRCREDRHRFPHRSAQTERNRRRRGRRGALAGLREHGREQLPSALADWDAVARTPLPVKPRHRAHGRNGWQGARALLADRGVRGRAGTDGRQGTGCG